MPYLYHNAPDSMLTPIILTKEGDPVLCAVILDAEGRGHRLPVRTAYEVKPQLSMDTDTGGQPVQHTIPAEKVAQQLCADGTFFGVVVIRELRDGINIHFDLNGAAKESERVRHSAETGMLERYVQNAKTEQLANRAIRPPSASVERILEERKLDLKRDYGLQPVGYKVAEFAAKRDLEIDAIQKENAALHEDVANLKDMISQLMKDMKSKREPVKA